MKKIKFKVIDGSMMKVIINGKQEILMSRVETRFLENDLLDAFIEMMKLWSEENRHKVNYKYPQLTEESNGN